METLKCHKETPCVAILSKQKCHFFLLFSSYRIREEEGRTGPAWGVGTGRRGEKVRRGCRRVNMVQILCTHVCKWKNEKL
jgi:hypothetical protein